MRRLHLGGGRAAGGMAARVEEYMVEERRRKPAIGAELYPRLNSYIKVLTGKVTVVGDRVLKLKRGH